jgi:hypothetical protein
VHGSRVLRELVEEESYQKAKGQLKVDEKRLDEACSGVTWVLCHSPEQGEETEDPRVWAMPTTALLGLPELVLYYTFDSQRVWLISIEPAIPDVINEDNDIDW